MLLTFLHRSPFFKGIKRFFPPAFHSITQRCSHVLHLKYIARMHFLFPWRFWWRWFLPLFKGDIFSPPVEVVFLVQDINFLSVDGFFSFFLSFFSSSFFFVVALDWLIDVLSIHVLCYKVLLNKVFVLFFPVILTGTYEQNFVCFSSSSDERSLREVFATAKLCLCFKFFRREEFTWSIYYCPVLSL